MLLAASAASDANGQVVFDKVRVNQPQGSPLLYYGETAIALSRTNPNEFIAAVLCGQAPLCEVHYAIATTTNSNGTPNIVTRATLDHPTCCFGGTGVDPFVAAAADGRLFIGGQNTNPSLGGGYYVAQKAPNATTLDASLAALCEGGFQFDKPLAAIGPISSSDPAERFVLAFSLQSDGYRLTERRWNMTLGSPACSASWTEPRLGINPPDLQVPEIGYPGLGVMPVVLRNTINAPLRVGRIVVASCPPPPFGQLPFVMYLNPGATQWTPPNSTIPLMEYNNAGVATTIQPIDSTQHVPAQIRVTNHPSIAFNSSNGDEVYVAFAGRAGSTTANVDLFIAKSTNGGETFTFDNTLRLTDDHLYMTTDARVETDQWQPSIGVDPWGGIHILYYSSTSPDTSTIATALFQVRYAYIPTFAGILSQNPAVRSLSPPYSMNVMPVPTLGDPGLDYHQLSVNGCVTAVCYMTTEEGTSTPTSDGS